MSVNAAKQRAIQRGAAAMMVIAAAAFVTNGGRPAWFLGVLIVIVYVILGMALYLLPSPT